MDEPTYQDRSNCQLLAWVEGRSYHNDADDECCPDFSCCNPNLQATGDERWVFAQAGKEKRNEMLSTFLGRLARTRLGDFYDSDSKTVH